MRFWENEFDEIKPKKKKSGTRKYTPKDVEIIQLIYHLVKERGMTLDGAKKQLKQKNNSLSKNSILLKLKNIKSELKELSDQL